MDWLESLTKFAELVAAGAVTIVAAFYGAKYAFQLEDARLKRISEESEANGANRVLFDLARTYNHFLAIRRQFIDDHRGHPNRFVTMPAMASTAWRGPTFEFGSLAFLLRSADANVMGKLSLLEQEVATCIELLMQRSEIHIKEAQPILERIFAQQGDFVAPQVVKDALGNRLTTILDNATTQIIDSVDHILARCPELIQEVRTQAKLVLPNHKFISMTPPPEEAPAPAANAG